MGLRSANGHCVECNRLRASDRYKTPEGRASERARRNEYRARNREEERRRSREYSKNNRILIREKAKARYRINAKKERERRRIYREEHREKIRATQRETKAKFREKGLSKIYAKQYYAKNSVRIALRNRVYASLKAYSPTKKNKKLAEYGIDLKAIEEKLGPCPGKRSDWHIDHIRPLASFDMSDLEQIKKAFSPDNHQWLTADANRYKSCKWDTQSVETKTSLP